MEIQGSRLSKVLLNLYGAATVTTASMSGGAFRILYFSGLESHVILSRQAVTFRVRRSAAGKKGGGNDYNEEKNRPVQIL